MATGIGDLFVWTIEADIDYNVAASPTSVLPRLTSVFGSNVLAIDEMESLIVADLAVNGIVDVVSDYGADPTGISDSAAAINAALVYGAANSMLVVGYGATFRIDSTILISCDCDFRGSTFVASSSLTLGVVIATDLTADPAQLEHRTILMPKVNKAKADSGSLGGDGNWTWNAGEVGVMVRGLTHSTVFFNQIEFFETTLKIDSTTSLIGTEHNQFYLSELNGGKYNLWINAVSGSQGWINENSFHGGDFRHSQIPTNGARIPGVTHIRITAYDSPAQGRAPSHNVFYRTSLEGSVQEYAIWCEGDFNEWHAPRFETFGVLGTILYFLRPAATDHLWLGGNRNIIRGGLNLDKITDAADTYAQIQIGTGGLAPQNPNYFWNEFHLGRLDEESGGWVKKG